MIRQLFRDPRYFQIIFQMCFLVYGVVCLHWINQCLLFLTYFFTCVVTQLLCAWLECRRRIRREMSLVIQHVLTGVPSAAITSLGLCLLLKTNNIAIAVAASLISIISKFVIRVNGRHIFNPSALGICFAVWLLGGAWISPGQWGNGAALVLFICCLGFAITSRIQQFDTSVAFIASYAGLLFIRQVIFLGWPIDHFVQSLSSGSLFLFAFFMITDPKTTPVSKHARIVWSAIIACAAFYVSTFYFINGAQIFVLIAAQLFVPLINRWFPGNTFQWKSAMEKRRRKMPQYNTSPLIS